MPLDPTNTTKTAAKVTVLRKVSELDLVTNAASTNPNSSSETETVTMLLVLLGLKLMMTIGMIIRAPPASAVIVLAINRTNNDIFSGGRPPK